MGIIKGLLNLAYVPVEVVKDMTTMGGYLTDEESPYTIQRLKEVQRQIDKTLKRWFMANRGGNNVW